MFSYISWQQYWTSLTVIVLAYYLAIYLIYFRKVLLPSSRKQVSHSGSTASKESQPTLFEMDAPEFEQPAQDSEEHCAYAFVDELNAFFENQKKTKAVKSKVMYALHLILQKYPALRNSRYRESLSNLIVTECEGRCSIHLSAEELKGVWFG